MNLKMIGQFLTANNLWDRKLSEFGEGDIKRLAELFFVAIAYPGDAPTKPVQARCLAKCDLCFMRPDPSGVLSYGVLSCGYCGRPIFDLYEQDGCPLERWKK